jgi:hypothetical protein
MLNKDEVLEIAREVGFPFNKYGLLQVDEGGEIDADGMFERFAARCYAAGQRDMKAKAVKECEKLVKLKDPDSLKERRVAYRAIECAEAVLKLKVEEPSS